MSIVTPACHHVSPLSHHLCPPPRTPPYKQLLKSVASPAPTLLPRRPQALAPSSFRVRTYPTFGFSVQLIRCPVNGSLPTTSARRRKMPGHSCSDSLSLVRVTCSYTVPGHRVPNCFPRAWLLLICLFPRHASFARARNGPSCVPIGPTPNERLLLTTVRSNVFILLNVLDLKIAIIIKPTTWST